MRPRGRQRPEPDPSPQGRGRDRPRCQSSSGSADGFRARGEARVPRWEGTVFLVAWLINTGIVAARFGATGTRLDATPIAVSGGGIGSIDSDALAGVFDGRDFALAYPGGTAANPAVLTRVTTAGVVRDRVTVPSLPFPLRIRLAHSASGYLVATSASYSASFAYQQTTFARFDANLAPLDTAPRTLAATPRQRRVQDVATDGTNYLVLWSDEATPPANAPRLLAVQVTASTGAVATPVDVGPGANGGLDYSNGAWAERVAGGYLIGRYAATGDGLCADDEVQSEREAGRRVERDVQRRHAEVDRSLSYPSVLAGSSA